MARRRPQDQVDETAAFVRELFERWSETATDTTWAAFAAEAQVHWASLSKWQRGKAIPDGYNLIQLVKAAGGVSQPQPQQAEPADLAATVARLEQVAESLQLLRAQAVESNETQLKRQDELLATLERAAASLPAAQPAPPSRRAGKRTA